MKAQDLLSAAAVRSAAERMLAEALEGRLTAWDVQLEALQPISDLVADITRRTYPNLVIPFHSRWRHFTTGGLDRWSQLQAGWPGISQREIARRAFDLVIPSVLVDAGSGGRWSYADAATGKAFTSSEGLGVASIALYRELAASHPAGVLQAAQLEALQQETFSQVFQVSAANPLAGVAGRVELLQALGRRCRLEPSLFAGEGPARPGGLVDVIFAESRDGVIAAPAILSILLAALGPIWPSRLTLQGVPLGDSWFYPPWRAGDGPELSGIVPFHKLSQWMTYSLIEPLQQAGLRVEDINGLTGLAEYRNGGLFIDGGAIRAKDERLLDVAHAPDSPVIVEWRALTVALIDLLRPLVAERLGLAANAFPLPCLLEGGTWAAGRHLAQQKRKDRSPPVNIISDGTVF